MSKQSNIITVFEHQTLCIHKGEQRLSEQQLKALERFHGEKDFPYYNLIYKGVKFKEYVGVIQVGKLTIEVLPKADKNSGKDHWRKILIGMLRAVGAFNIQAPSSASLNIKTNFILDLYFELFIKEVEYLLYKGLIKKYRKTEGNRLALKGSLQFAKQIQHNLVHQERFYVRHTTYDQDHLLHQIIYKTLHLLRRINNNPVLSSCIGKLLLNFPEMRDIKVTEATFKKISLNRKSEGYKNAIEVSRLLLLNYHPDLSNGRNHVLALMFDMNLLWERFIYVSLRKHLSEGASISAQTSKYFWKPKDGNRSSLRPDIFIKTEQGNIVLDTKWKNIYHYNSSADDLRQMFAYHEYFDAKKVALVYPGDHGEQRSGQFLEPFSGALLDKECSVILLPVKDNVTKWQAEIYDIMSDWISGVDNTDERHGDAK